jgi:hypothetical protein
MLCDFFPAENPIVLTKPTCYFISIIVLLILVQWRCFELVSKYNTLYVLRFDLSCSGRIGNEQQSVKINISTGKCGVSDGPKRERECSYC